MSHREDIPHLVIITSSTCPACQAFTTGNPSHLQTLVQNLQGKVIVHHVETRPDLPFAAAANAAGVPVSISDPAIMGDHVPVAVLVPGSDWPNPAIGRTKMINPALEDALNVITAHARNFKDNKWSAAASENNQPVRREMNGQDYSEYSSPEMIRVSNSKLQYAYGYL